MALVTSIFGGETLERGRSTEKAGKGRAPRGFLLSDQEYYDIYIRPKEAELMRSADSTTGSLARSSRAKQSQFLQAQGLGGSVLAERAGTSMNPAFQRAVRRARQGAQVEAEDLRRRRFAERDRVRASEFQKLGHVTQVESALAGVIPFAGPAIAAVTGGAGAAWQAGLSDVPRVRADRFGYGDQLDVYDFEGGDNAYDQDQSSRTRGGGGYDLYA